MSSAVIERRNREVFEALEAGNLRQAAALCQKRIKKGEKSDTLLALQAIVLLSSEQPCQVVEGIAGLRKLIVKDPAIVDLDTLKLIRQGLEEYALSSNEDAVALEAKALGTQLWDRALKAKPHDENLAREWFFFAFKQGYWKDAQKASLGLQRSRPQKREYHFWVIVCCHLISSGREQTEADQKLFGTLAYRLMSKVAQQSAESSDTPLPARRSIQTTQELHLMISIFRAQQDNSVVDGALEYLSGEKLGLDSEVAKGDWGFVRDKIDILEQRERWEESWNFCRTILVKARPLSPADGDQYTSMPLSGAHGDDWRVWDGLIRACKVLNTMECADVTQEFILLYNREHRTSRNARLAWLKFVAWICDEYPRRTTRIDDSENEEMVFVFSPQVESSRNENNFSRKGTTDNDSEQAAVNAASALTFVETPQQINESMPTQAERSLLEACKRYFNDWATKPCAFEDLRPYCTPKSLGSEGCQLFLEHVNNVAESLAPVMYANEARINARKFEYLTNISSNLGPSSAEGKRLLERFIPECLKLYKHTLCLNKSLEGQPLLVTDNQPGDDACLLAVVGLVHLARLDDGLASRAQKVIYLLQAGCLLDHLLSRSKHNYQALLILVRLYHRLGAGSLALTIWPRLDVKQIQHDTLSYNLLTRISTTHPHAVRISPYDGVDKTSLDPGRGLMKALDVYPRFDVQIQEQSHSALQHGSYDQIQGFVELGERLRSSVSKYLWGLELRRIGRLLRNSTWASQPLLDFTATSRLVDNRDHMVFLSCDAADAPPLEYLLETGPVPKDEWLQAHYIAELIFDHLSYTFNSKDPTKSPVLPSRGPGQLASQLYNLLHGPSSPEPSAIDPLTSHERIFLTLMTSIALTLSEVEPNRPQTFKRDYLKISQALDGVKRWAKTAERIVEPQQSVERLHVSEHARITSPETPGWMWFHQLYLVLDGLWAAERLLDVIRGVCGKGKGGSLSELRRLVEEIGVEIGGIDKIVKQRAAGVRNGLERSGVVGGMVDCVFAKSSWEDSNSEATISVQERAANRTAGLGEDQALIGRAIEELMGEAEVEIFVGRVVESWVEGLDGLLKIKIEKPGQRGG